MRRRVIKIDKARCDGCGLCVMACHESAIIITNGKAALLRDEYCDGLGDCLPACPQGAVSFEEREAAEYNEGAVKARPPLSVAAGGLERLKPWPLQIKLTPVVTPYFEGADLLVAADCAAYAHSDFHNEFMRGKVALIGCPRLDDVDYSVKLAEIFRQNRVKSVTVTRMELPCCGGLERAVKTALEKSATDIPCQAAVLPV